jgi:hypothetical protein
MSNIIEAFLNLMLFLCVLNFTVIKFINQPRLPDEMAEKRVMSLYEHCRGHGANCCYQSDVLGSGILDTDEVRRIQSHCRRSGMNPDLFDEIRLAEGSYWVLKPGRNEACIALIDNQCSLQGEYKPDDCVTYPIKVIPSMPPETFTNSGIVVYVNTACLAAKCLDEEYVREAIKLSTEVLGRFKPEVFQHWLTHHAKWPKPGSSMKLEDFLRINGLGNLNQQS